MRDRQVYIGIDPTAGRRPSHIAVLDAELRLLQQAAVPMREIVALVDRYPAAICAVDAPKGVNRGLLTRPEVRTRVGLPAGGSKWSQYKLSEFELQRRGIKLYNTPLDPTAAPGWMQAGWKLYDELRAIGYQDYHPEAVADRQVCEVHPHASFAVLLGTVPFKKTTLEGRLQRQLLLFEENIGVPDAMEVFEEITRHHLLRGQLELEALLSHDALDAIIAALTAHYAGTNTDNITLVGDREEGYIVVPTSTLKERYS
ncbi:MAG: DUF429 domain-containing protein [Anaerolineales bacterium]